MLFIGRYMQYTFAREGTHFDLGVGALMLFFNLPRDAPIVGTVCCVDKPPFHHTVV